MEPKNNTEKGQKTLDFISKLTNEFNDSLFEKLKNEKDLEDFEKVIIELAVTSGCLNTTLSKVLDFSKETKTSQKIALIKFVNNMLAKYNLSYNFKSKETKSNIVRL